MYQGIDNLRSLQTIRMLALNAVTSRVEILSSHSRSIMITAYLPDTIWGWVRQSGDFEQTRSLEAEVKVTTITACCINVFSECRVLND